MVTEMQGEQKPKGKVGFWIGGLLLVLGVATFVGGLYSGISGIADTVEDYQRVSLDSGGPIRIDDPGTYRVFFEADGADDGFGSAPPFTILGPDGDVVSVRSDFSSETYSVSGYAGRKLGKARFPVSGTYEVQVISSDGIRPGDRRYLAVGKEGPAGSVFAILGGVFGGGALVLAGIIVLIVSGVRRSRSRRASFGYPGGPHPGAFPPAPYPGAFPPAPYPGAPRPGAPPAGPPGWASPPAAPPTGPAWNAPPPPPGGLPPAPPDRPSPPSSAPPASTDPASPATWTPAPWTPPTWTPPSSDGPPDDGSSPRTGPVS